jgi:hypothetical protein
MGTGTSSCIFHSISSTIPMRKKERPMLLQESLLRHGPKVVTIFALMTGTEQFMEQAKEEKCGRPLPNKNAPIALACQEQCCRDENGGHGSPVPDRAWYLIGHSEVLILYVLCLLRS